jgi:LacI family transcriptional regulator
MAPGTTTGLRSSPPTIRDVAALAGTSLKTVSRVVNGEAGVSADLVKRVQVAIDRLDYHRNLAASNLRRSGGRTRSIGLLLSNVVNPLDAGLHRAIEEVALDRGVVVLASSVAEDAQRERELVRTFTARRVDGLIIMAAGHDQSYLSDQRRMSMSIVFVDRPPAFFDADAVVVDNEAGTARGVAHLIAHGHRRIGYLGAPHTIVTAVQRLAGYRFALAKAGVEQDESLVQLDVADSDHAYETVMRVMTRDDAPTALFASQNLITVGVVRALRQLDMHRRVALVGFDDVPLADLLEPAVTVLAQDPSAIGSRAATTLFERLDGSTAPTRTHVIPVTLVERGSGELTGPHRVRR